jgi:hypothetical protein
MRKPKQTSPYKTLKIKVLAKPGDIIKTNSGYGRNVCEVQSVVVAASGKVHYMVHGSTLDDKHITKVLSEPINWIEVNPEPRLKGNTSQDTY